MLKNKLISIFMLIMLMALLAACGNSQEGSKDTNESTKDSSNETTEESKEVDFPTKDITLIVPYNAGGVSDILARSFAEAATGIIDANITIKNVNGGSGTVGNYELVRAEPDGYTWLWAATGHISSTLHVTEAQYTKDDFEIVNKAGDMVVAVVVPKDSPFETFEDLVKYAKENPGQLNVGNPGEGTVVAMLQNIFADRAEVEISNVPFDGSGPLLPAVLGGHIDAAFMNVPEVLGQVQAGELKALAVLSEERVEVLPDVPTAAEAGVEGVAGGAAHFIIVPNGVDPEIVAKIDELSKKVYESEKFIELMNQHSYQLGYKNGADAKAEVDEWFETTKEIYKKLGLIE